MKINEINQNSNLISNSTEAGANRQIDEHKKPVHEAEKNGHQGTQVDISDKSVEFSKAAEMMDNVTPERAAKIDALKEEIDKGTYDVDSNKIADKILDDLLTDLI